MRVIIVGPGRAGLALGLGLRAHHEVVAVVARRPDAAADAAEMLGTAPLTLTRDLSLPAADLLLVAVRDDAIGEVASRLAALSGEVTSAVHLSGIAPVAVLADLEAAGWEIGSLHPLQTLPTPAAGAARLAGAWFAVTADEPLRSHLHRIVETLGGTPFDLRDDSKPLYHAAAAAAANFPLGSLALAEDLFRAAGVPFAAARPLVEAVVANAFELGPRAALTGPVARGDVGTVAGQIRAVDAAYPDETADYMLAVDRLARLVGNRSLFDGILE